MKKIGIDARLYSQTGVGVYLQNLLYFLDKKNNKKNLYYVYLTKDDYEKINFNSENIIKKVANYQWHTIAEQVGFLLILLKDNLDLIHFTYFSYPFFYPKAFVATIHDLTPLFFKTGRSSTKNFLIYWLKFIFYQLGLRLLIKRAKKIITPSKSVADQIKKTFSVSDEKIKVIYEGVNYQFFTAKENESLKKKFQKFFIYVGNFYPHKNVERLIKAFIKIKKAYYLVLIGPNDFFCQKIRLWLRKNNFNKKIIIFNNSNLSDLVFFYKNAQGLIHPSLSEGFGLPILEACYFNCPIIASKIPVFQEILDNNYLSFDPYKIIDIKNKINFFIENKNKINYQINLKNFSFEKMTEKTLKIYDEIVKNGE